MSKIAHSTLWRELELESDHVMLWHCGTFSLYLKHCGKDWLLAPHFDNRTPLEADIINDPKLPKDLQDWRRWALKVDSTHAYIRPTLPDRPIVVRPRRPFILPPGESARFYIHIPICAQVFHLSDKENIPPLELDTFPTVKLTHTWFGTETSGRLCYSLKSPARRILEDIPEEPNRAICPVKVYNHSNEPLEYQKICLQTKYLNIYLHDERLWTNEVKVRYLGNEQTSELTYKQKAPMALEGAELLTPARRLPESAFFTKTAYYNPFSRHF